MTATDVLAWIGTLTGTTALIWDVYKWKTTGPRLLVSANPNMVPLGPSAKTHEPHLVIRVANSGTNATTLTALGFHYYPSVIHRLIRRGGQSFVVLNATPVRLPYHLEVGKEWSTVCPPNDLLAKARQGGVLVCEIDHALSRKPTFSCVRFV